MDISSLTSLLSSQPSLLDYMDGSASQQQSGLPGAGGTALSILGNSLAGSSGDSVNISPAALLLGNSGSVAATSSSSSSSGTTDDQTAATNFLNSFFTANGIDTSNLSSDAQNLLQGFQDLITSSGATTRDMKTDTMEQQYNNGNPQVYTLTGTNTRLRIAIAYTNGQPATLNITDINGGKVDSAALTIAPDSTGTPATINISRSQQEYANNTLVNSTTPDSLAVSIYGS